MRLPRFTTRRLMVLVAVIAIPFGIVIERRNRFRRLWRYHGTQYQQLTWGKEGTHSGHEGDRTRWFHSTRAADFTAFTEREHAVLYWHEDLMDNSRLATPRPWLPVPPDPPPPE